ncbi:MAG: hypothetical protein ABIM89_11260, partial [Mycobacteriales bacterium]
VPIGVLLPLLGSYDTPVTIALAVVVVVLATLVAERFHRAVFLRNGELVLRKWFRPRRVSLRGLTELRAEKLRSGSGTRQSDFTRFHLGDSSGRRLSIWARDIADAKRLAQTLSLWARYRGLQLDAATESLLQFESGGGLGGVFRESARTLWKARKESRRR